MIDNNGIYGNEMSVITDVDVHVGVGIVCRRCRACRTRDKRVLKNSEASFAFTIRTRVAIKTMCYICVCINVYVYVQSERET
jgi:hypothetical protein